MIETASKLFIKLSNDKKNITVKIYEGIIQNWHFSARKKVMK